MPVKRPKRKRAAGSAKPTRTSGIPTKKNSGVARRAGRGKLGGGVVKVTPTKRSGKPKRKPPQYPGMYTPGTQGGGMNQGGGVNPPVGTGGASKKKKKKPKAR